MSWIHYIRCLLSWYLEFVCIQVVMHLIVCCAVVCRADKRVPEEGVAKDPKMARRSSKAPQEEGGDAVQKEKQQGAEVKKVGRPVYSSFHQ